jgi:hypothetical protein
LPFGFVAEISRLLANRNCWDGDHLYGRQVCGVVSRVLLI